MGRNSIHRVVSGFLALAVLAGCGLAGSPPGIGPGSYDALASSLARGRDPVVAAIGYRNPDTLTRLVEEGMDVYGVDPGARRAYGAISRASLDLIRSLGLRAEQPAGLRPFNDFDAGYHTYDELLEQLRRMAGAHPTRSELVDLGPSYETLQGTADRRIWALRIRTGEPAGKPGIVFLGNHHAREIVTPEICLEIARALLDGYGHDAEMTAAVENRDTWIVPMVNPDGHALATQGHDWRKNTDPEIALPGLLAGPGGPGVDLNRNYTYKWGGRGASTNPRSATFRGKGAGSEPETQAIMTLVSSRPFSYLVSYHSFSNLVLWPWGHTIFPPPDDRLPAVGRKLGALTGYRPQQSKDLYITSGDTTDWAFGTQGILSYTIEIGSFGDGFDPPYSRVADFWRENEPGVRYLLKTADDPGAVFGPGIRIAAGRILAPEGSTVEAFFDRPGHPGTGLRIDGSLPASGARRLVFARARLGTGPWGPTEAAWSR